MTPSRPALRLAAGWVAAFALLVLAGPVARRIDAALTATRFVAEFLSEGRRAWLSGATHAPGAELVVLPGGTAATLWRLPGGPPRPGLVLVHGLTPDGKDDVRLARAAALLARAGFAVLVPDLPAMRTQRLSPDDAAVVAAALAALVAHPVAHGQALTIVAISVGIQPALAAAVGRPRTLRLSRVIGLGGYGDARELIRHFTTGRSAGGGAAVDPALAREFLASNLDLVRDPADRDAVRAALRGLPLPPAAGAEARAVLAVLGNRDPDRVDALLAALPPETQALLDALSPVRVARRLDARLLLVHGRDDPAIPFTESLRLAAAADPARTRVVLVDVVAHVEGRTPAWRQAWDLAQLWSAAYELIRG